MQPGGPPLPSDKAVTGTGAGAAWWIRDAQGADPVGDTARLREQLAGSL